MRSCGQVVLRSGARASPSARPCVPTLAERSAVGTARQVDADPEFAVLQDRPRPVLTRHCWVTGLSECPGRWAGLLAEWRQDTDAGGWRGPVLYAVDDGAATVIIEAWVPAGHLQPAGLPAAPSRCLRAACLAARREVSVALALLGLSLKPGGGLELLVQDPAAAPSASGGFCEAGCVELAVGSVGCIRPGPGGLLRADRAPSSAASVPTEGCAESLVLPAQPALPYFLSPPGWYRASGRSGPNAASARSAALPIAVVQARRASRSSR